MRRAQKEQEKRAAEAQRKKSQTKDVTILIRGVDKNLPEDRFAYTIYHAIKNISRDVTVVANKGKAVNAESVSRESSGG